MIALWWYYGISLFLIGVIVVLLIKQTRLEQERDALSGVVQHWVTKHGAVVCEARRWKGVAATHKQEFADLVTRMTPLLEKTDWCSGRYARSIEILQAREATRNRQVDEARRVIMNSQAVASIPTTKKIPALPAHLHGTVGSLSTAPADSSHVGEVYTS